MMDHVGRTTQEAWLVEIGWRVEYLLDSNYVLAEA
jgi:hypothetical protein